MKSNLDYLKISLDNKESLIDPNYHLAIGMKVIPNSKSEINKLMHSNVNVIKYISAIDTLLNELNYSIDSLEIRKIIDKIIVEFKTNGMNYSALGQYFAVHNMTYSIFKECSIEDKVKILQFIIRHYIADRHGMYLSHGYSNMVLQVVCDNYSQKRKGNFGVKKITGVLNAMGLKDVSKERLLSLEETNYYLTADKAGKRLFKDFVKSYGLRLCEEGMTTEKYPDALIKIGSEWFVVEHKNMKEGGGGQNKQTLEVTAFIRHRPEFPHLHYVTYVDGIYFNSLNENAQAKKLRQYDDIVHVLENYKSNYFVNDFGFNCLIKDVLTENEKP